jgi:hypothetical protein
MRRAARARGEQTVLDRALDAAAPEAGAEIAGIVTLLHAAP